MDATRREFFKTLVLASAGLYTLPLLKACQSNEFQSTSLPPFSVWEEILEILKTSPDNLIAQRELLIKEGDAKRMTDFVKSSFSLIPTDNYGFRNIERVVKFGENAAMRTGMATPRMKAEILKNMLVKAGYDAKVVRESIDLTSEETKDIFFRPSQLQFNPDVDENRAMELAREMGHHSGNENYKIIENSEQKATELATELLQDLPSELWEASDSSKFVITTKGIPSVLYKKDGKEGFAHTFDPEVKTGSFHPKNPNKSYKDARSVKLKDDAISITLHYSDNYHWEEETLLIEGHWKASNLVGNQLKIGFLKNLNLLEQASKTIDDIQSFTPYISLQDLHASREEMEEGSFLGDPVLLNGEKILENVSLKDSGKDTSKLLDTIVRMELEARPKGFPLVEVRVFPYDESVKIIEGLSSKQFTIKDNDRVVTALMKQNQISPRILFMHDASGSMPSQYLKKGEIKKFLDEVKSTIKNEFPNATIKTLRTGSRIYTSHLKACKTNADLILYATDGHNSDKFKDEYREIYKNGPPCLYLNVNNSRTRGFKKIKENTQSKFVDAKDQKVVAEKVREFLSEMRLPPYVFTYNSFDKDAEHIVKVDIENRENTGTTTFKFTNNKDHSLNGKKLTSLILRISINNTVTKRIIAGWDPMKEPEATLEMSNDVHEMLLGGLVLAIEKEGATLSTRMSEYLQCLLTNKDWFTLYQEGEYNKALEEIMKGRFDYPPFLLSMMQPLSNLHTNESVTFPEGYKMGLIKMKAALHTENTTVTFDYLPTSKYITITKNGNNAFIKNLEKTAQLAILEYSVFSKSTFSELAGIELQSNMDDVDSPLFNRDNLSHSFRYFNYNVINTPYLTLFDQSLNKQSYWRIDRKSGELLGILPDQSGGGENGHLVQLKRLQNVIEDYRRICGVASLAMTATGTGGPAIGVMTAYSILLVRLYALASEAIIIMDAGNLSENAQKAVAMLACDIFKELVYTGIGPSGSRFSTIENLIMAFFAKDVSFIPC